MILTRLLTQWNSNNGIERMAHCFLMVTVIASNRELFISDRHDLTETLKIHFILFFSPTRFAELCYLILGKNPNSIPATQFYSLLTEIA